jgi:hypothetical protein
VACFLTFAISPLLVRSKVRRNLSLVLRMQLIFLDTADAIFSHAPFSTISFATLCMSCLSA